MTAQPFDWDDELPPETEDEVYRALLRALQRKRGFGLFFVQCSKDQGAKIVANLRRDLPQQKIEELYLQGEVTTLYDPIADLWHKQPFDVLVVEGLEASLYAYEDVKRLSGWSSEDIYSYSWKGVPKLLNHLNQQREHLRNDFPARLVFLVPPFVVDYFIQRAADFLDWRSGLFRFPRDPKDIAQDAERFALKGDYDEYLTLTPQARIEKILNLKSLQEICSDAETKLKLLVELGLIFAAEQDFGNAVISWEKALEIKVDDHAVWSIRGAALTELGRYEAAVESYNRAVEIKPDYQEAWYLRGIPLKNLERYEAAIASYDKAIAIKPEHGSAWYSRGLTLKNLGRYEAAIESYDKAIAIKSDYYQAWAMRGVALVALDRYDAAIESYDKAIAIKSDYYQAWAMRGIVLNALKCYGEALASYEKALELKPDYYNVWFDRGLALCTLERCEEAIASYDKALEFKPDYHEALYSRGNLLYKLGRYDAAIASYDKALDIKPDKHEAWYNRGNALKSLGRTEEAIASYDRSLKFIPDDAGAYYNKACCYGLLGQIDLAVETLKQAIVLNSEYRELAKTDSDFEGIRDDERFQVLVNSQDS